MSDRKGFTLRDGERLDDLYHGGMRMIQHPEVFCFSVDSILLAHFVTLKRGDRAWDLGTGTGVLPLLMTARADIHVNAVEINAHAADLARRNFDGNGRNGQITLREGDYRRYRELFPAAEADVVVVNPPYMPVFAGAGNRREAVNAARHEVTATKEDVLAAAVYLLRYGGRLAIVQRANRAVEWMCAMEALHLRVKRLRWVHTYVNRPAKMVLIEARWHGNAGTEILPPLVLYRSPQVYTDEVLAMYGKKELL